MKKVLWILIALNYTAYIITAVLSAAWPLYNDTAYELTLSAIGTVTDFYTLFSVIINIVGIGLSIWLIKSKRNKADIALLILFVIGFVPTTYFWHWALMGV